MTDRYQQRFDKLKAQDKKAFVPFTVLGWPDPERCFQTIKMMIDEGASALELGIAFSDPVADGPTIQQAAFKTLEDGFSVDNALQLVARVRAYDPNIPIGLLSYLNPILARGAATFFQAAAEAGVDSVLVADLPAEGADELEDAARQSGIALVFIVSPLTTDDRLRKIGALSKAYIYVVSRLGITGSSETHDTQLEDLLVRARALSPVPLLVGFGVSSARAAREMFAKKADGVITGSKIIELIGADQKGDLAELRAFLHEMTSII